MYEIKIIEHRNMYSNNGMITNFEAQSMVHKIIPYKIT